MPASTVSQLENILGEYVEPGKGFASALAQVLPRLYAIGLWRDTTYETSMSGEYGYVSLPHDTDAVLACTVDNRPRPLRNMWHDVRIVGRQATVSNYFGSIDDGYRATLLEMYDVQGVELIADVVPTDTLHLVKTGSAVYPNGFTGSVSVETNAVNDGGTNVTTQTDSGTVLSIVAADDFSEILSIRYYDVNTPLDLIDPDFPSKVIATIPKGTGTVRYRRFRTTDRGSDKRVHMLVKRSAPSNLDGGTLVHLGNIGAIKHALLGLIAEDNADTSRAGYHWGWCGKLLDEELSSITGAAKPMLRIDLSGGGAAMPIHNLM